MRDEKGKRVESNLTVRFVGYHEYMRELLGIAGIIDPELEAIVDKLKREEAGMRKLERFFGRVNAVVEA